MTTPVEAIDNIAVSIVVPMHNAAPHLRHCLDTLTGQTLSNIEILCFDDASSDDTASIVREYRDRDPRIRLIQYPENRSSSQARKDGALAARGEYLMFVDADDYLDERACEDLRTEMDEFEVDILQFGTTVINTGGSDAARVERLERFLAPLEERLEGREPFERCFADGHYGHSLWNKMYRSEMAKRALAEVPDGSFPKGQDVLAYFALAWHARSYRGIPFRYYNYRFGAGVTGVTEMSLERLKFYCTQARVADAVEQFARQHRGAPGDMEIARKVRRNLASDCVQQWFHGTPRTDAAKGFDLLVDAWGADQVAGVLHRNLQEKVQHVAMRLPGASALALKNDRIPDGGTIGVFYHRLSIGGIQRVLSILIPMYVRMGYKVVMLLEEEHAGEEFELPGDVRRVLLPKPGTDYLPRGQRLRQVIASERIDAIIHCASSSATLLYDLLVTKCEGIPFILSIHDSAFHSLLNSAPGMSSRPAVARLADAAQVLSEAEEVYWRSQGVKAVYVPNPVTTDIVDEADLDPEPGNLLWVGRLDVWVKRCLDLVQVMATVAQKCPTAKLQIVGKEWTAGAHESIEREVRRLGLEDNLILREPTLDIEKYYRTADVVVLTSVTECSPMTVVEAKAFGVPIAMYELPHLAMLRDGKGYLAAPQGDHEELARQIVSLIEDRELRQRIGREGRESLARFAENDLEARWRDVFARSTRSVREDYSRPVDIETMGALISNALEIHSLGVRRRQNEVRVLRQRTNELEMRARKAETQAARLRHEASRRKPTPPAVTRSTPPTPRRPGRALVLLRRLQPAVGAAFGVIAFSSLLAAVALGRWQIAAVAGVVLFGYVLAMAAIFYKRLLRRIAVAERRLGEALPGSRRI